MRAVLLDGHGGVDVVERPIPVPGASEVVIQPAATGICGTDLVLLEGQYPHGRFPVVPGHEFCGRVAAAGPGVTGIRDGDWVGIDPNVTCGECRWCRQGAPNLCTAIEPIGVSVDGSCAEYVCVPGRVVFPLSESLSPAAGALVEPLACVLHAVDRVPDWGDTVMVIFGAGSIGLIAISVARHLGVAEIHVVEPHAPRREMAMTMGAASAAASAAALPAEIGNVDLALDASGHPAAIQAAVQVLGVRGRLIQMGVARPDARIEVAPFDLFAKEISLIGSNSLATSYPAACELMLDLQDELTPLVTSSYPLTEYRSAVGRMASPDSLKVQVVPDGNP